MESNAISLQKARQAQDDDNALRAVMRVRHRPGQPIDWDGVVNDLEPVAPALALKISDTVLDQRIKLGNAKKDEAATLSTSLTTSAQVVAGILSQGTDDALQRGKALIAKIDPTWASQLGDRYDEGKLREVQAWGTTAKDALDRHKSSIEFALKAMELSQAAARDRDNRDHYAPTILDNWSQSIATQSQNINNAADATKMAEYFKGLGSVPSSLIDQIADVDWKTFKARGTQLGISPKDREQLSESKRGNDIAQGNLNARNKELNQKGEDAADIASSIIAGDQPPVTTGLYGLSGKVRAELARKGYNLTTANEDWTAMQKYLASANSVGQLRLTQQIDTVDHSLDLTETLAKEWKSGGFGPLSRARLKLAEEGAYGAKAQSLSSRLNAQVADVVAELAGVYRGGNTSTDKTIDLATNNLKAEWGEKAFVDSIAQIRLNLGYRRNAIRSGGPITTTGTTNRYGSSASAPDTGGGAASSHKVGDTVEVGGKRYKIDSINPDGTFEGTPVK